LWINVFAHCSAKILLYGRSAVSKELSWTTQARYTSAPLSKSQKK
jgi:hypothetical protein